MNGQESALSRRRFSSAREFATSVIKFAARNYIAGSTVVEAGTLAQEAARFGYASTLCYWNDGKEPAEHVASQYRGIIDFLGEHSVDGWLAIKLPALGDRLDLAAQIISQARSLNVHVMIDSHAPGQADTVFRLIDKVGAQGVGCAIPGRWRRSLADAEQAIAAGLFVRVVKGQWADPDEPDRDLRAGFLDVIDCLAGRAVHVGVATHDPTLAEDAFRRLQAARTPCAQELLYPDPIARAVKVAENAGVSTRLYVPFGDAWLPYSVSKALQNPRTVMWLARDVLGARRFKMPRRTASEPTVG